MLQFSSFKNILRVRSTLLPTWYSSRQLSSSSSPPSSVILSLKDLFFFSNTFLKSNQFLSQLERYDHQNPFIFQNIITSANDLAEEYHYNLRETRTEHGSSYEFVNGEIIHNVEHKNAFKIIGEKGFLKLEEDISRGGVQIPYHVSCLARMPFAAANIGLCGSYLTNTRAVVRLLDHYPNIKCKESLISDMLHGISNGAVCLTERHSNISLTDVRCRAEFFAKDRSYRIRGTKTCVYGGAHEFGGNIFYIVSARLPNSPDGIDGLSLFIVPKFIRPSLTLEEAFAKGRVFDSPLEPNDITIKRVHKIGNSACSYVDLEFGVQTQLGAFAFLIGKENEGIYGIRHHLLYNNIQLGYNSISCGLSAFYHSLQYASDPQALETLHDIPYSQYSNIKRDVSPYPDDGNIYITYKASLPYLEKEEQERIKEFLEKQDQLSLLADGKHIKRPLLARPDIKSLLLSQKAYLEGGLSLCVYATHLLDIIENDHNKQFNYNEIVALFEFLIPIVKFYCTKYSLQSIQNSKQIYDGIGVVDGNIAQDMLRDCEIFCQDGFNNTLHALDLLNYRLTSSHGRGYHVFQKYLNQTINEAINESNEFKNCISIINEILVAHIEITKQLLSHKSSSTTSSTTNTTSSTTTTTNTTSSTTTTTTTSTSSSDSSLTLLANSKEYMELTGHLVISWMWLQQGIIAYQHLNTQQLSPEDRNFYYGKICTLDYYCNYELIKAKGLIELLKLNPQMNNSFSSEWF